MNADAQERPSESTPRGYQTLVVSELLIPLAMLSDDLDALPGKLGGNEVQVAPHEYGVAGAAFLLLGAIIEGSIQGARLRVASHRSEKKRSVIDHLPALLAACDVEAAAELTDRVEEVLAVRNAVAHSHVWEGEIDSRTMRWTDGPRLIEDRFGDKRHTRITDGGLVTKRLGMNVLPTKIGRTDVSVAVTTLDELWAALASCPESAFFITLHDHWFVKFRGDYMPFCEFVAALKRDWQPLSTSASDVPNG